MRYISPMPNRFSIHPSIDSSNGLDVKKMSRIHAHKTLTLFEGIPINKDLKFISNIKEFPLFTSNFHLFHCTSWLANTNDIGGKKGTR